MSWLPPRARAHGEQTYPWRPPSLGRGKPRDFHYLLVEELFQSLVGVALSSWPQVDEQGRLRFPAEEPLTFAVDRASLERYLAKRRPRSLRKRALRIGDVFAVKVDPAGLRAVADQLEQRTQLEPVLHASEFLRRPVYDVTADAREVAKASFYAAVSGRLSPEQAASLRQLLEPGRPGRISALPSRLQTSLGTPVGAIAALSILALAGLGGGTALGRETRGQDTVTLAGSTTTLTTTLFRTSTVSRNITKAQRTTTVIVNHTTSQVSTETIPRQVTLTLTLIGDAPGTVTVDPPGSDCSRTTSEQTCEYQISAGTPVSLKATTPAVFGGWGLKDCVRETCTLNLGQSLALTADFYTLK
jgi:hypothetical protein